MASLFLKQAKQYLEGRPNYPNELFRFIASKTPVQDIAWDVGTGSGQAATSLAALYKNVVATDTSEKQLEYAPKLPNIQYKCTTPNLSLTELEQHIAPKGSVDLITIAQAMHWFDLPLFYQQAKYVLKKPNGVIAAWCYTIPRVNSTFDSVFDRFYAVDSNPFWEPQRKLVDDKYRTVDFPFDPVDKCDGGTGPIEFLAERLMDLEEIFTYVRSWSAYQTAKAKGVELLSEDTVENFRRAWITEEDGDGNGGKKVVTYPVYLRIGKVGNLHG